MRTHEEIQRALQIISIAMSDAMKEDPQDESKLTGMVSGMMALSWARKDGSDMDRTFQEMIEVCNAHDATKRGRHQHKHK